jgi:gluconokinase
MQYILGIDIGTGSTKAIAVGINGEVLGTAQQYYETHTPQQGISEQNPEVIWQQFIKCVHEIVTRLNTTPAAISLSSALHSLLCADEQGNALTPMMTWADTRSSQVAETLKLSAAGEKIYRTTGTPIHAMSPLCKLIWLRDNKPAVFKSTPKFLSIKDYIWYKLFRAFQVDYSIASATGLFDSKQLQWSKEACELAGINPNQLSETVNTTYSRKDVDPAVAQQMGIPADTAFIIGAGDGCTANLGSHVTGTGIAALTIGTSGAVRITGPEPVYDYSAMIFNYLLDDKTFISGGAVNNGGIAVNWLLKNFLNKSNVTTADYEEFFKAVETIPAGSDGLLFLPYLYGERAPIWDADASGAFLKVRSMHTQHHFLRAGLEGICFALNDVLTHLEASSSTSITQINVSGGFITSATWVQLLADVMGKNLVVFQLEDASALGAVYLAAQSLYGDDSRFKAAGTGVTIHPNKQNHAVYKKSFALYKALYTALSNVEVN